MEAIIGALGGTAATAAGSAFGLPADVTKMVTGGGTPGAGGGQQKSPAMGAMNAAMGDVAKMNQAGAPPPSRPHQVDLAQLMEMLKQRQSLGT